MPKLISRQMPGVIGKRLPDFDAEAIIRGVATGIADARAMPARTGYDDVMHSLG